LNCRLNILPPEAISTAYFTNPTHHTAAFQMFEVLALLMKSSSFWNIAPGRLLGSRLLEESSLATTFNMYIYIYFAATCFGPVR
jgi:hypothetical protein